MRYARTTSVPVGRTKAEIESVLMKYGATAFMTGWNDKGQATIAFRMHSRSIRFLMPEIIVEAPARRRRNAVNSQYRRDQAERAAWRSLLLLVKAKLEAVESGFVVFEEEFLPHIVTETGETVFERLRDRIGASGPLQLPANF